MILFGMFVHMVQVNLLIIQLLPIINSLAPPLSNSREAHHQLHCTSTALH